MALKHGQLDALLRRVRRARRRRDGVEAAGWAAAAVLAAALAAVFADAALGLGPRLRVAVDALLIGLAAAAAARLVWRLARRPEEPRRLARLIEARMGLRHSQLINGVELAAPGGGGGGSVALRELAVAEADELAARLLPEAVGAVADAEPAIRAVAAAGTALAAAAALVVFLPAVFAAVIPRYLWPAGDNPPYSGVEFHAMVLPHRVYRNRPANIIARMVATPPRARLPGSATVVFTDTAGQRHRWAMIPQAEGQFILPIDRVERGGEFYIETPEGRSRRRTLEVLDGPVVERAFVHYRFPSYTRWGEAGRPLEPGGVIRAIEGTRVTLSVESNLPLRGGRLLLAPARPQAAPEMRPMQVDPSRTSRLTVSFQLAFRARFTVSLEAVGGATAPTAMEGEIVCVPDAPPSVALVDPPAEVSVPAGWPVPVTMAARDDVGVARIELQASAAAGGGGQRRDLHFDKPGEPEVTARVQFDPAAVGVGAGADVLLLARAYDACPAAGPAASQGDGAATRSASTATAPGAIPGAIPGAVPGAVPGGHSTQTPPVTIHVVGEQDYARLVRAQHGRAQALAELDRFLGELAALAAQRDDLAARVRELQQGAAGGDDAARRAEAGQAADDLGDFARRATGVAGDMSRRASPPRVYAFDEAYSRMLTAAAEGLRRQAGAAADLQKALRAIASGGDSGGVSRALAELGRAGQPAPEVADALGDLRGMRERIAGSPELAAGRGAGAGVAVLGPHFSEEGSAVKPPGAGAGPGHTPSGVVPADPGVGPGERVERWTIRPPAQTRPGVEATTLGVPLRYRDDAAAYFRRLAEDGR